MAAEQRADRRRDIVRAASACIARDGYERTSTARICAVAEVSSGTFFHYFPTKADVLVAILAEDLDRTREVFAEISRTARRDADLALGQWRDHVLGDASDPDLAGLVAALGSVPDNTRIASILHAETDLVRDTLTQVVTAGSEQNVFRSDLPPERIAMWLDMLARGILAHAAEDGAISADKLSTEFADAVNRLIKP